MTEDYILNKMKSTIGNGISTVEGTLVHDALAPVALMLAQGYTDLDGVLALAFVETSEGEYLDRRAAERPVWRKPAVAATVTLLLAGDPGTVIPAGSVFSTVEDVMFASQKAVTLSEEGSAEIFAVAIEAGASGNVPSGSVTEILSNELPGTLKVTNPAPATGGANAESDESLLARYLQHIREPATSGNPAHYVQWAREVLGVGAARCIRTWDGPGTVKVIIVDEQRQPVDESVIERCAAYIAERHPIGPEVTVESAAPVMVGVAAKVTLLPSYTLASVTEAFASVLCDMMARGAFESEKVLLSVVGGMLIEVPGVQDYEQLVLNGSNANVQIPANGVAVLGEVVLSL